MKEFKSGEMSIKFEKKDEDIEMFWLGVSNEREPSIKLEPYLELQKQFLVWKNIVTGNSYRKYYAEKNIYISFRHHDPINNNPM